MMSKDNFARRLRKLIEEKTPFVAYWHSRGYGVMLTEPVTVSKQYLEDKTNGTWRLVEGKAVVRASKSGLSRWAKNLARMRRSWYTTDVVTVEYDGDSLITEGDLEL